MSISRIVFVFEGPYHLKSIPNFLKQIGRDYPVVGNYANNEEMFSYVQEMLREGAEIFVSAGGYYDYLTEHLEVPIINLKRSYATIALVANKAREMSDHVAFIARKGILYASALRYKEEFKDPIILETFANDEELHAKLQSLKERGVDTLIVGSRGSQIAPQYGFNCLTVPFEDHDVMEAVREAERILKYLDITRKTSDLLRLIQNSVNEGIAAVNKNNVITEINNYGLNMLNCSRKEIQGLPITETLLAPVAELDAFKQRSGSIAELVTIKEQMISVTLIPVGDDGNEQMTVITFTSVQQLQRSERRLQEKLNKGHRAVYSFKDIIGSSPALQASIDHARRFARVDSSVLITAETGCGKEMFAQSIHNASRRRNGPFVVVNCAALPENLLESSLFGYEKGAFTGAAREGRQGSFLSANGGTIFLDEVSEMPLSLQARFLRVLQEKEIVPLGSDEVISVDVRVLAATNRNMPELIEAGSFRRDLYYRLAVLQLEIPNLNERKEDIPALVRHFMYSRAKDLDLHSPEISDEALAYLQTLHYSGNIRQLQNITERFLVLHNDVGPISLELVKAVTGSEFAAAKSTPTVKIHSRRDEKEDILEALRQCDNNRVKTAEMLGISTVTLWRKLKKYGLA